MSIRELEQIITKLEKSKGMKAGACKCTKGGRRKRGGELVEAEQVGSGLSGGEILGMDGSGLSGGEILGMDGSGLTGAGKGKRGRKKKQCGGVSDFSGESQGSGLTGAGKKAVPPQLKAWLSHVQSVKAQHPGIPYKEVLRKAKESY